MYNRRILPFYLSYPLPIGYQEGDAAIRDLEYLQQLYSVEAKKYQKTVVDALNRLDYEGSMIYDEYPDQHQLSKLSEDILEQIRQEEEKEHPDRTFPPEKWEWAADLIQMVLFNEVFKRRHHTRRGILSF